MLFYAPVCLLNFLCVFFIPRVYAHLLSEAVPELTTVFYYPGSQTVNDLVTNFLITYAEVHMVVLDVAACRGCVTVTRGDGDELKAAMKLDDVCDSYEDLFLKVSEVACHAHTYIHTLCIKFIRYMNNNDVYLVICYLRAFLGS